MNGNPYEKHDVNNIAGDMVLSYFDVPPLENNVIYIRLVSLEFSRLHSAKHSIVQDDCSRTSPR